MELINSVTDWTTNAVAITNIAIAIGTIVLAVGIPLAIKSAGREERDTFYATLDRTYLEIQNSSSSTRIYLSRTQQAKLPSKSFSMTHSLLSCGISLRLSTTTANRKSLSP